MNNNMLYGGKGIINPDVLKIKIENNENLIIIDSTEVYIDKFYETLKSNDYNVSILNLKDTTKSQSWNFLEYPFSLYKNGYIDNLTDLLKQITLTLTFENSNNDPFWFLNAASLIEGIIIGLFEDAKYDELNLKSIWSMLDAAHEKFEDTDKLTAYFNNKDKNNPAYICASSAISAPRDTKQSIISVAKSKMKPLILKDNLNNVISREQIRIDDFSKEKQALFIIMPEVGNASSVFAPIYLYQLMMYLMNNKSHPKCNILISNLDTMMYIYNLDAFLQVSSLHNIDYFVNIVSEDLYKTKYGPNSLFDFEIQKNVDIDYNVTRDDYYYKTEHYDISIFSIDNFFKRNNIVEKVVANVDDIIRLIDQRLEELDMHVNN